MIPELRPTSKWTTAASRRALTLIELLVVITIIAVLAGIALPVISGMKESGNSVKCASNLRQICTALNLYCADNNNYYPPLTSADGTRDWDTDAIDPYLPERSKNGRQSVLFICPTARYVGNVNSDLSRTYTATDCLAGPKTANYSYKVPNSRTALNSVIGNMLLFDGCQNGTYRYAAVNATWPNVSAGPDLQPTGTTSAYIDYRHRNAFHGLFADGHVETIKRADASKAVTVQAWRMNNQ